jgi:beta-N-acetylhexosaminidase
VHRQLLMKERLGLDRRRVVALDSVYLRVGDSSHAAVAARAAERSITLAKDSLRLVPIARSSSNGAELRVLSITLAPRTDLGAGQTFVAELRRGLGASARVRSEYANPDDPGSNFARLLSAADSSDLVLVLSHMAPSYSSAAAATSAPVVEFLRALARRNRRSMIVNFGNPYLYRQVPEISTYVVAWGGFPVSQRAAAQALLGVNPITGRLPIGISTSLPLGAGDRRPD